MPHRSLQPGGDKTNKKICIKKGRENQAVQRNVIGLPRARTTALSGGELDAETMAAKKEHARFPCLPEKERRSPSDIFKFAHQRTRGTAFRDVAAHTTTSIDIVLT
jgi:hypothetical protein